MKIRKFKPEDTKGIASVIKETFLKYNHGDGSKKAVERYVERFSKDRLSELSERLSHEPIVLVAEDEGRVVGVVRGNEGRVWNLFVDGRYHGHGIGAKLMDAFEGRARNMGSHQINIKSSLYAVGFYQHQGYKKTTGIRASKRLWKIKYQPMVKRLD